MNNTDYHDPLRTDGATELLSRKEQIKGVIFPWATQGAMFLFSAGLFAATRGMGAALNVGLNAAVVLTGMTALHSVMTWYETSKDQSFDFSKEKDRDRFRESSFGYLHRNLPENFLALSQSAGLKKAPVFRVRAASGKTAQASAISTLLGGQKSILVNTETLQALSQKELLPVLGHEMTHLRHNHTPKRNVFALIGVAALLLGTTAFMGMGAAPAGLAWMGGSLVLSAVLSAKQHQYHEREADRGGVIASGLGEDFARALPKVGEGEMQPSPKVKSPSVWRQRLLGLQYNLFATHPRTPDRMDEARTFDRLHKEFSRSVAARFLFYFSRKKSPSPSEPG